MMIFKLYEGHLLCPKFQPFMTIVGVSESSKCAVPMTDEGNGMQAYAEYSLVNKAQEAIVGWLGSVSLRQEVER
jgi:hypothetical protein